MVADFHILLSLMVILVLPLSLNAGRTSTVVNLAPIQILNYEKFWRYWSNIVVKIEANEAKKAEAKQFETPINYERVGTKALPKVYMADRARKAKLAEINQQKPIESSPITLDEMVATFKTLLAISGFASLESDSLKTHLTNTKISDRGIQRYSNLPVESNRMIEEDDNIWRILLKSLLDKELLSSSSLRNEIHVERGSYHQQDDYEAWGEPSVDVIKYYKMPVPKEGRLPSLLDVCADKNKIFPDLHRSLNDFQRLGSDPQSMQKVKETLLCMLEKTGVVNPSTGKPYRKIRLPIVLTNLKMLHRFIKDLFPEYKSVNTGEFVENIRTLVKACETEGGSSQLEVAYRYYKCLIDPENSETLGKLKNALKISTKERAKIEKGKGARGK